MANALSEKEAALIDVYWRAANYLSIGQIYLYDNPRSLMEPEPAVWTKGASSDARMRP
jgi:phosphoketolase